MFSKNFLLRVLGNTKNYSIGFSVVVFLVEKKKKFSHRNKRRRREKMSFAFPRCCLLPSPSSSSSSGCYSRNERTTRRRNNAAALRGGRGVFDYDDEQQHERTRRGKHQNHRRRFRQKDLGDFVFGNQHHERRFLCFAKSSFEEYEEENDDDDDDENENENGGGENKITKYTNTAAEVDQELYIPKPLSAENKLERLLPKDNYDAPVSDEERFRNLFDAETSTIDPESLNEYGERIDQEKWYNLGLRRDAHPVARFLLKPFTSDITRRIVACTGMLTVLRAGYIGQSRLFDASKVGSVTQSSGPMADMAKKLMEDPSFAHMGDVLGGARQITEHGGVTIFHLGIGPFVAGSIIMQVLMAIDPQMKEMKKDRMGMEKLKQQGRYLTLIIALILGAIEAHKLKYLCAMAIPGFLYYMTATMLFAAGAMIITWVAQEITDYGIGEGSGMIITMSICASYASTVKNAIFVEKVTSSGGTAAAAAAAFVSSGSLLESGRGLVVNPAFLTISGFVVLLTFASALLNEGTCKIPLQFFQGPDASQLPKSAQSESSEIPIRVNPGGMTMIIAFSMLCGFFREQVAPAMPAAVGKTLVSICDPTDFSYYVFLFVFCIAGSYIDVQNTPKEVAEYITKIGARIPNVRPGVQTEKYLRDLQNGAKFFGGVLLGLIACVCSIADEYVRGTYGVNVGFTSMLICTSTMLSLKRQIRALGEVPSMKVVLKEL